MNIFYCWQADTPEPIGKSFIRLALDKAVSEISETMNLDEAERPSVDQDTQGVLGSPAIVETIFRKIRNSEVIVVDVTLVGETPKGKKFINSNIAYELGYAHGFHGDQVLLKVMNTYYGPPSSLPFDLTHRRWPVAFEIAPDAPTADRRKAREALAREFTDILRLYIENQPPGRKHEPTPSTTNAATYWSEGELLVRRIGGGIRGEARELGYAEGQPLIYLRVWPDEPLEELSGKELGNQRDMMIEPLFGRVIDLSYDRNQYGGVTYPSNEIEGFEGLPSTTQVFKNREIWGVEAFTLREKGEHGLKRVPITAFEKYLIESLKNYLSVAYGRLGYPDLLHVKAGLVNVKDFYLDMPSDYIDGPWGPLFDDVSVQATVNKRQPESATEALLKIFEGVFDAAGRGRPEGFKNFP